MSARLDEALVNPESLFGLSTVAAVAAASTVLVVLAKLLLGALFTKMSPEKALEHESRRRLHAIIRDDPGISFRALARKAGIPTGTTRHHLTILARSGLIEESSHGATQRFFLAGTAPTEAQRVALAVLREETLARLHAAIMASPWLPQTTIIDNAERDFQWSRSTTQHRLDRLVKAGLVKVHQSGRWRLYAVREEPDRFQRMSPVAAPAPSSPGLPRPAMPDSVAHHLPTHRRPGLTP